MSVSVRAAALSDFMSEGPRPSLALETQSAFARCVGERLDAAVIDIAAAVEHHFLDALRRGAFGDELAARLRRPDVGAGLEARAQLLLHRRRRSDGRAGAVVDHLGIDVLRRAKHRQPRPRSGRRLDGAADARLAPFDLFGRHGRLPLLLLAFLAEDVFARISHALALVGLGRPEAADFRRDLPDLLLVHSRDQNLGRLRRHDRDALRDRIDHVVAVAERDLQILALHRGAIADAGDLELVLETLGDAGDEVRDEGARGTPHGAGALGLGLRINLDRALVHLHDDLVRQHEGERALGPLHLDGLTLDIGGDARRDRNRFLADT